MPSSKSICNRALILHALANGSSPIGNLSDCDDTRVMIEAMAHRKRTIDIMAAGTAMRFLTAFFAIQPDEEHILTGTERMQQRPIRILVEALRTLGADIEYMHQEGFPPILIKGRELACQEVTLPGNVSSQYISALLMIAPMLLPESILERFTSIGNMADTSTSYRVYIWMGTLAMLKDYWFSGVGPGEAAFNMAYPAYAYHEVSAPHAHNLFLQILSDAGVPGLLVFGLLLISFYRAMFTSLRVTRSREKQIFLMAGSAAVTGFLVQSMTDYTFYNYRVMLLFWATLAISVLFARLSPEKEGAL